MHDVVVIGAGAVGSNVALFLSTLGHEVALLEAKRDLLTGAPQLSFIHHGDGFEYYKPGHYRTGEYCIEGAFTKALIYPIEYMGTDVCNETNPVRFFLTSESVRRHGISIAGFLQNIETMKQHFTRLFHAIRRRRTWSEDDAASIFLRRPHSFCRQLAPHEYSGAVSDVAVAYVGSSFGINMPHYYAMLKSALRSSRVACHFDTVTNRIEKDGTGYRVQAGGREFRCRQVVLCAGHQIPGLVTRIASGRRLDRPRGTYFLNSMSFLRLPATKDERRRAHCRAINFSLQQTYGGMYACLVAPTASRDGYAAIYYPSPDGSQRHECICNHDAAEGPSAKWDALVANGLPEEDRHVRTSVGKLMTIYPFLRDYAEVSRTHCRAVFNVATRASHGGQDRRVREIPRDAWAVTADGNVSAWAAPKWTNAELVALMASDYVHSRLGGSPFPRHEQAGCGPMRLDVARITERINYRDVRLRFADARRYAEEAELPLAMIRREFGRFVH